MIKLKTYVKLLIESSENVTYENPHDTVVDYYDDLNRIEKESGINILRNKDLHSIAIKDGKCVGALYTSLVGENFSFDIIVDKNEQNKGIGNELFKIGMDEFKSLPDTYTLKLDVVNPNWVQHHLRRGLKIVDVIGNHTIMTI